MMDLIRPCANCPFRMDKPFYLGHERREEIARSLSMGDPFLCHETLDYEELEYDDFGQWHRAHGGEQHCAGALIVLQKEGRPNQAMQVMERLGFWNPNRLVLDSPVFDTLQDFMEKGA